MQARGAHSPPPHKSPDGQAASIDRSALEVLICVDDRAQCPIEPLVAEVEKRNRLRVILPFLEARVAEGNQAPYQCLQKKRHNI